MFTGICVKTGETKTVEVVKNWCTGCSEEMSRQCDQYNENNHKKYTDREEM